MGLFENKIRQFPETIAWAKEQDVSALGRFLTEDDGRSKLFLASGGSYSAAAFAEQLSADRKIMAHALTPYIYQMSGFKDIDVDVLLISASGANNDIARAFDVAYNNVGEHVGAMTLQSLGKLQKSFAENNAPNLFCYDLPTGRDGFLSTNTVLAFYVLLYRAFGYTDIDLLTTNITEQEGAEISEFVDHLKRISLDELSTYEAYLHKLEGVDSFFILYSAKSLPAALDIESKFSEGAVGNTQLADYRNFAHGRFNWFTQRPGQTGMICLQTPDDMEMSEEIVSQLPCHVPVLRLRTNHTTPLGMIDLLIKEHYLCSALGQRWGLDLSHPVVPEYGRNIHNM